MKNNNSQFSIFNSQLKKVPELRFPEFKNNGEWVEKKLGEVAESKNSQVAKNKLKFLENGYPVYGADGLQGYIENYEQETNYIAIVKDGSGVGMLFYYEGKSSLLGTLNYINVKKDGKLNLKWLYYLLNNIDFRPFIKGSGIPHIYFKDYSKLKIPIPSLPEQQKIAAFLSNLDELIAAHKQKLELLKQHKKGLMQKLFPQEGKKLPELRFPEFKNDGEWEEKKLGEVGTFFSGGTPPTTNKDYYNGDIPFIGSSDISKNTVEKFITKEAVENSSAKMIEKGDILYALYGATSGEVAIAKIKGAINQAVLCIRTNENKLFVKNLLDFLKPIILSKYLQGGQGNLSADIVKNIFLTFPSKQEQQKIAAFLSNLDELITAEAEKIEQLEGHKKGLMQRMFPASIS